MNRKKASLACLVALLTACLLFGVDGPASAAGDQVVVSNFYELQEAVTAAESGGPKTILCQSGLYQLDDAIAIGAEGITVRGISGNRDDVVLDGGGMYGGASHVFNVYASGFTVENVSLCNVTNHAIQLQIDIDNVVMRNLHIYDTYEQMVKIPYDAGNMSRSCDNGIMENCLLEYTAGTAPEYYTGGIDCHNAKSWIVRGNTFVNIRSPRYEPAEHAVHFWSDSQNTLVERNTVINCDRGIGFGLGDRGHQGGIIRNNFVYSDFEYREPTEENGWEGSFPDVGIGLESARDVQAYNNTVYIYNYPNAIEYRFGSTSAEIRNNLTSQAIASRDGGSAVLSNNLESADIKWFVAPASGDLHLAYEVGQVVDQGAAMAGLTEDIDGDARPYGSGIDIGADEWVGHPPDASNRAPVLQDVGDRAVDPGQLLSFKVTANDPDGDEVSVTARGLPSGASFVGGTFEWVPSQDQVGYHFVNFQASDGALTDSETIMITVRGEAPQEDMTRSTWYLAEGSTAWGFDCYVSIVNPNDTEVTADITYMTKAGELEGGSMELPPASQATVNPRDTLGDRDFSTRVDCREGRAIAVDRTMVWTGVGSISQEGHCSIGVTSPKETWYLAEGSSAWGFECWLLVQNPNDSEATCQVTYMIEGESPSTFEKKIPANSRRSYNMADDIGERDASIKVESDLPVIPERAMYRNSRRQGHDSIGTTYPWVDYYLAEGTTGWGFTTYVLLQNPNEFENSVQVTYMTPSGVVPHPQNPVLMPANSRKTIRVDDHLADSDFSTRVTAEAPVIAERAMYWGEGGEPGEACHDSVGLSEPHRKFYLPDGQVSGSHETWVLVQNPNDTDVDVEVTYVTPDGTGNVTFDETIPANSRQTFSMADAGINGRAAALVESRTEGKNIVVERAIYWNGRGAGTDTVGGYSD